MLLSPYIGNGSVNRGLCYHISRFTLQFLDDYGSKSDLYKKKMLFLCLFLVSGACSAPLCGSQTPVWARSDKLFFLVWVKVGSYSLKFLCYSESVVVPSVWGEGSWTSCDCWRFFILLPKGVLSCHFLIVICVVDSTVPGSDLEISEAVLMLQTLSTGYSGFSWRPFAGLWGPLSHWVVHYHLPMRGNYLVCSGLPFSHIHMNLKTQGLPIDLVLVLKLWLIDLLIYDIVSIFWFWL